MGARIFQKIPNNMQRGRKNDRGWILQFEEPQGIRADPLMGWAGSGHTQGQVRIDFPTREAAVAFAEREGIDYRVVPTPPRKIQIRSYADNFTNGR